MRPSLDVTNLVTDGSDSSGVSQGLLTSVMGLNDGVTMGDSRSSVSSAVKRFEESACRISHAVDAKAAFDRNHRSVALEDVVRPNTAPDDVRFSRLDLYPEVKGRPAIDVIAQGMRNDA
ncbi:MAG: hypothetical protein LBM23_02345 [Propionibacteriaceae bacterium]|jgi:hypothetical protein|nr:hypothetical protein [Propionibacteriaceae bacterium]